MPPAGAARTRRCRGGTFGLGWHVTDGRLWWKDIGLLIDYVWRWMPGGDPPGPPKGRAAKRESSRSRSRSTRAVVGRRSVGARGGDAHDGAAALRRVRDVRAAAWGRGRQRCGRALGNGDAVRRRVPFMSRLAARQAGGAGRGAENIFVLEHTNGRTRTHKNPEVGSFSLTSFL